MGENVSFLSWSIYIQVTGVTSEIDGALGWRSLDKATFCNYFLLLHHCYLWVEELNILRLQSPFTWSL